MISRARQGLLILELTESRVGPTINNLFISQTHIVDCRTLSLSRIEETGEGVGEVGQVIAFGALGPDSHDVRVDSEEGKAESRNCESRKFLAQAKLDRFSGEG